MSENGVTFVEWREEFVSQERAGLFSFWCNFVQHHHHIITNHQRAEATTATPTSSSPEAEDVLKPAEEYQSSTVLFVKRSGNQVAHRLSKVRVEILMVSCLARGWGT